MESVSGVSGREWIAQKLKMNRDGDGYRDRDSQKNIDVKMKENMVVTHTEKIVMKEKESSTVSMKEIIVEKQHIVNE